MHHMFAKNVEFKLWPLRVNLFDVSSVFANITLRTDDNQLSVHIGLKIKSILLLQFLPSGKSPKGKIF